MTMAPFTVSADWFECLRCRMTMTPAPRKNLSITADDWSSEVRKFRHHLLESAFIMVNKYDLSKHWKNTNGRTVQQSRVDWVAREIDGMCTTDIALHRQFVTNRKVIKRDARLDLWKPGAALLGGECSGFLTRIYILKEMKIQVENWRDRTTVRCYGYNWRRTQILCCWLRFFAFSMILKLSDP